MAPALLMYTDTGRSMDLFHAIPASIIDPFLYAELDGRRVAVLPEHDHGSVRAVDEDIECVDVFRFGRKALLQSGLPFLDVQLEVARRACEWLGVREAVLNWDFPVALADRLRGDDVTLKIDAQAFERRRRVKTRLQLDGIRRAQHAADLAMASAAELVREARDGLTAEEVRAAMQAVCEDHDATLEDDVIVAVNAQAALGHDSGSGPIAAGDNVLIDIWPRDRASRCWADMTRTFMAGGAEAPGELAGYWRLAREALDVAMSRIRPGTDGREVHLAASEVFERAGEPTQNTMPDEPPLPDHGFLHALGHGVGLEVHEAPGLGLAGDPIVAGDVVAVEPGCYRKGFGGVRLEDLVLVTDDGPQVITDFPYGL